MCAIKIALVGNELYQQFPLISYGGIESSVESTAWGLHEAGVEFSCIVPRRISGVPNAYPFEVIETSFVPAIISKRKPESFMEEVVPIIRSLKPDIVWTQSNWSVLPLLPLGLPIIATFQDSCLKVPGWMIDDPRAHYRFVSKFQFNNWVKEDWEHARSFQVYTGFTENEFEMGEHDGGYYLWVAGLNWGFRRKGLDTFIRLALRNPDQFFVAYGTGNRALEVLLKLAGKYLANFEFRGVLPRGPQHAEAFKKAKAFIMPTRIPETLGRTVIESLSKGTPVIGTANGALPEIIAPECGVATNDSEQFNAALRLTFDANRCLEYSRKFHVKHEVRQLLDISVSILNK